MTPRDVARRGCLLLVAVLVLQVLLLFPQSSGSDPVVTDNLDGTKTALWELEDPANLTYSGISVSGGVAELERVDVSFTDDTEADFLNAEAEWNVSVDAAGNVRLSGNSGNLTSDGEFSLGGTWTYVPTPDITAGRNVTAENAQFSHSSGEVNVPFDDMEDIAGTGWLSTSSPGSTAGVIQESVNRVQGFGSMNVSFDSFGDPANWGGGRRPLAGGQNWTAYNTVTLQADTDFMGAGLELYVNLSDGIIEENLSMSELTAGWKSYSFSLASYSGDISSIQEVRLLVSNVTVPVLVYIDDVRLLHHKSFDQTAYINQTFVKPDPTSGQPHGVVLIFDYLVENVQGVSLYNASVRVNNSGTDFIWGKEFVATQPWTQMYFDLSSYLAAADTYQISLSLRLVVDTSAACQADLRFDHISLIWFDYNDGWLASQVFYAGSMTTWENISWAEGPPNPAYDISVRTRTGNVYPPNGSWSPWSAPLANPGAIPSPPSQFIQYNASLTTTNGSLTPFVDSVTIEGWHYAASGFIETMDFTPAEPLVSWRDFNATHAIPPACTITYWYWDDVASSWISTTPGSSLSALTAQNITLRADLTTSDTLFTPQLFNMSVDYEFLGAIDHIIIDPDTWNGNANETHDFDATAYDAYGHVLSVTFTWTTTDPNGTIDASGFYSPHDAGTWTVTASSGGVWANATVNVSSGPIASLEVKPAVWVGTTDESADFDCRGYDIKGNEVVIAPAWNTTDPLGVVGVTGTYFPGSANASGSVWTIYCNDTISSMSDNATVIVAPGSLHTIHVSPYSLGTVTADDQITLNCYGYDFFDNFIGPIDVNWSLSGSFGTISSERRYWALFEPDLAGAVGNITATYDANITATTDDFLIEPGVLANLTIVPDSVELKVGQEQQFMVVGYDADGNEVTIVPTSVVWSSNVGSVTQDTLRAQTLGDGWMNATVGGVTASASVSVKPVPQTIWDAVYWPWSVLVPILLLIILIFAFMTVRQLYAVEDVFVVGNEGRLIAHKTRRLHADRDEDILAGMLTAIQEFIRDSFRGDEHLRRFDFGDKSIVVQKGDHIYAAAIFAGRVPKWAEASLMAFISDFEQRYGFDKQRWSGDVSQLEGLEEMMALIVGVKRYKQGDWEKKLKD